MPLRPLVNEPDIWDHLGFLLAEDEMLRAYLTGITAPGRGRDDPDAKVGVWFRWPEGERQIRYPFITIDALQVEPAYDLFTSSYVMSTTDLYWPSTAPELPSPPDGWTTQDYSISNYLPFRVMYQVAVHSRSALHDRYLQSIFATDVFPPRPFWLKNAADGTWRRTELMTAATSNLAETTESGGKRIFRKVYTISVLAEIPQERLLDALTYKALRVLIPVTSREEFDNYRAEFLTGQPDPLDFTLEEREAGGEYTHVFHQGQEMPSPSQ